VKASPELYEMVKHFEGCRLEAYQDSVGVWTIGYGRTLQVENGDTCTQEQADEWLGLDIKWTERCVNGNVEVPLAQHQFDALVDFTFNVGCGKLAGSTLLRLLNRAYPVGRIAEEFPKWRLPLVNGKPLPGIMARRAAEARMFNGGDWRGGL